MFSCNEVKIFLDGDPNIFKVNLWYVMGVPDVFYPSKIAAESEARRLYPREDPNMRVMYRSFYGD